MLLQSFVTLTVCTWCRKEKPCAVILQKAPNDLRHPKHERMDTIIEHFFCVWQSCSAEFAFHITTCSCCINNSCTALPNQHVKFTDARIQTQREPSQRVHRADIDMHEHIQLHISLSSPTQKQVFKSLLSWSLSINEI